MRPTDEPARPINLPETMLAPESILFLISDVIVLVWTVLKILVNHLIDSDPHRPNARHLLSIRDAALPSQRKPSGKIHATGGTALSSRFVV